MMPPFALLALSSVVLACTACAPRAPSGNAGLRQPTPAVPASIEPIPVLTLPAPPASSLKQAGDGNANYAGAVPVTVDLAAAGQWTQWDERRRRLRWELNSPQARTLSLHFSEFQLPPGALLRIYDPSNLNKGQLELTADNNQTHGQYWTPQFAAQRIRLDLVLSAASQGLALKLADINIAY